MAREANRLIVGFDTTDYTRFGFWRREYSTFAARNGYDRTVTAADEQSNKNNGFAFSPLEAAVYAGTNDPVYPKGTARYSGKTIANQATTRWTGKVDVTVGWDSATITSSDVTFVISDLVNPNGLPATHGTGGAVSQLIFAGSDNVVLGTGDNLNEVRFATGTARASYQNRLNVDVVVPGATVNGSFVGKGLDGPLAVIGTWRVNAGADGINGGTAPMVGGFGADLVGAP